MQLREDILRRAYQSNDAPERAVTEQQDGERVIESFARTVYPIFVRIHEQDTVRESATEVTRNLFSSGVQAKDYGWTSTCNR